ncbi:hypothetical protein L1987_72271 [Smallanthus sonchifolius]|uniref:Uncharacterized protein n=1 Tax=Smallanthus sonchifolius TaxID=185202 RepID=A0ACB9AVM6_9ASTR|nr:hypothetical protein L1987_72271 [Smallanthus sonchifolius]
MTHWCHNHNCGDNHFITYTNRRIKEKNKDPFSRSELGEYNSQFKKVLDAEEQLKPPLTSDAVNSSSGGIEKRGRARAKFSMIKVDLSVEDGHLCNMGKLIEELERKPRNQLDQDLCSSSYVIQLLDGLGTLSTPESLFMIVFAVFIREYDPSYI